MTGRKVLVVDPGLRTRTGHHYHFDLSVAEQAEEAGLGMRLLAHAGLSDRLVKAELGARPVFQFSPYDGLDRAGVLEPINTYFAAAFAEFLTPSVADGDIVLFHSIAPTMAMAVGEWLAASLPHRPIGAIAVCNLGYFQHPELVPPYRRFLDLVADLDPGRLKVWTENAAAAEVLAALDGGRTPITALPLIFPRRLLDLASRPRRPGPVVICSQGHSRVEKGTHLLAAIAREVGAALGDRVAFAYQVNPDYAHWPESMLAWLEVGVAAMRDDPRVDLLVGEADSDQYYDRLERSRLVLVPYITKSPEVSSGLFMEALTAGRPTIIPAGGFMEREARRLGAGHVCFTEGTAASVAAATIRAVEDITALEAASEAARHRLKHRSLTETLTEMGKSTLPR
ncbi:hypothetical protein [Magnetospirillum sp. UT-4]|uniref:hypothetical protein n=1 Tax=Magnetospirillum sp. UT-4 TaxID=2681467 RepID=UPI001381EDC0|nr:hypothetical protein [Magnetospirillum sp. UT-4]CAA7618486.1 hypothetical protein MTBUT4_30073 [Magnetospirillum sp. UT-4]